jgi:ABC-type enterochelin transport system, permease component
MLKQKQCIKVIGITSLIGVILTLCYVLIGLNDFNIGYFLPLRIKKVISILLVSYCIGASSTIFQTITNNKILTPSVMGLDALYMFIQTVVIYFFGSQQLVMMQGYTDFIISVGFMIILTLMVFFLLFKKESSNVYFIVLAGMVIGGLFNGLSTFMQVLLDPNEFLILQGRMFASFNNINNDLLWISMAITILTIVWNWKSISSLDVISLGREAAINLGVDYYRLVRKEWIIIALLVAVSTALVGPITFLGILLISLSRQMVASYKHRHLIVEASLLGFVFLMLGLVVVERIFNFGTTISVIINFVGGIYFMYLMIRESKND